MTSIQNKMVVQSNVSFINKCNKTYLATANKALTDFSPSPIHLDVIVEALILKNVELD